MSQNRDEHVYLTFQTDNINFSPIPINRRYHVPESIRHTKTNGQQNDNCLCGTLLIVQHNSFLLS